MYRLHEEERLGKGTLGRDPRDGGLGSEKMSLTLSFILGSVLCVCVCVCVCVCMCLCVCM